MVNKINTQTDPIFQFTELTPKDYEMMPEEGLYLLRCKLPEDDWAGGCKKDMDYDLTKQIRHHGIGNWGKDGGFHVYSVAVSDNFKEGNGVTPLFILHMLYCGEGRYALEIQRREIAPYKKPEGNMNGENFHYPIQNKKPHLLAV